MTSSFTSYLANSININNANLLFDNSTYQIINIMNNPNKF